MIQSRKLWLSFAIATATVCGLLLSRAGEARADRSGNGFSCLLDVTVETRSPTGVLAGIETYQREFSLDDGGTYFDDFSTRLRFKFLTAVHQKNNGDDTISIDWFADVTVFNSVDFTTEVTLADGQKSGKATGTHTFYNSSGSTTTTYTLLCVEN